MLGIHCLVRSIYVIIATFNGVSHGVADTAITLEKCSIDCLFSERLYNAGEF